MSDKLFLDSNLIIYAADKKSLYHNVSVSFIKERIKEGFFTADICLVEFFQVITDGRKTKNPLSPEQAIHYIKNMHDAPEIEILETGIIDIFDENDAQSQIITSQITKYEIYDLLIALCLKKHQVKNIATFNIKDFNKYKWLKVVDPRLNASKFPQHTARKTLDIIPYGRQSVNEKDVAAVCSVLRSDFLTQGPKIPELEKTVADYCGARFGVAVNSGTSALHIACLALGLGSGDILWTSPITFVASANCGLYCGAEVDFVDIDPRTYNLCTKTLAEKLAVAEKAGKLPKVVVPVHLCGQPCDMAAIHALSKKYGFRIIEDASHAIGGRYQNEPVGNCRYSDITVFSFHPVKLITTGEGGMAMTNNDALAQQMALLRTHGITRDPAQMTHAPDGPWYYQQIALGFNYRMTDIQAALGISQMDRLDEFVEIRRRLAARYDQLLTDLPVATPWQHPDGSSAWHLYVIRINPGISPENTSRNAGGQSLTRDLNQNSSQTHRQVFEYLREKQVGANLHYIPVHLQPWYTRMGFAAGMFSEAEKYYQEAITLPLFPAMTDEQQDQVTRVLKEALK